MDITNISSFWMCLTILAQNVFEHFVSVYKITPCTCFDVPLATFLCENLVCLCVSVSVSDLPSVSTCVFCNIAQCVYMCLFVRFVRFAQCVYMCECVRFTQCVYSLHVSVC